MTIGIDASRANRKYKTGTEWYSYYLIRYLAEIDSENKYLLYCDKPLEDDLAKIVSEHHNFEARILRWPFDYFWTLGRLTLAMIFRAPDVLFVPAHSIPLIHPRRTVTTIHDIAFKSEREVYVEQTIDRGNLFNRRLLLVLVKYFFLFTGRGFKYDPTTYLDWSTRYALRHAKKIITVSFATKNDIMATYHNDGKRIKVIHNGYNDEIYRPVHSQEKIQLSLDKYGLNFSYLLYVGRLERKKNLPVLLEAFAIFKENNPHDETKLVLVGHAGFGYDDIKYIIEEYNLNSEVVILGWVDEIDLPFIYNGAKAFIFPSRHEGFGIPILQSLACGLPTAVSDIPVLREVAGDAVLYFDYNDKQDVAKKMAILLQDEKLREELKRKGLARASEFSWKKCAEETRKELIGW
jgi:glycosyltransferase involved in cell wall biosynthesis